MKTIRSFILIILSLSVFTMSKAQIASPEAGEKLLSSYFSLKNALVSDDNASVKISAKELLANIINFPSDKLDTAQQKIWSAYHDKLEFDSRHISESDHIAHQREHFRSLSKNMYQVISGLTLNKGTVYVQYCPMKKATWLSETATIRNPYFGKQMPGCGKITETINPAQ